MELTIKYSLGGWIVCPLHNTANRMITPVITCNSSEEAMDIQEQLNGKRLQEIEAFIKLRNKLRD